VSPSRTSLIQPLRDVGPETMAIHDCWPPPPACRGGGRAIRGPRPRPRAAASCRWKQASFHCESTPASRKARLHILCHLQSRHPRCHSARSFAPQSFGFGYSVLAALLGNRALRQLRPEESVNQELVDDHDRDENPRHYGHDPERIRARGRVIRREAGLRIEV